MKVVINNQYGSFNLSPRAIMRYAELKGITSFSDRDIPRDDPTLIQVVEELGKEANGLSATLKIVNIPKGVNWEIEEFNGNEWVSERLRIWQ